MRISTILLAEITATATAEPVVAILPEQTFDVLLQDFDPGLPQARMFSMQSVIDTSHTAVLLGLIRVDDLGQPDFNGFFSTQFDGLATNTNSNLCGLPIVATEYWDAGLLIPDNAQAPWVTASGWYDVPPCELGSLVPYPYDPNEDECAFDSECGAIQGLFNQSIVDPYTFDSYGPLEYLPLREYTDTPGVYRYGWVAMRVLYYSNTDCGIPDCTDRRWPLIEILAVGFETTPDTPITVGGGACVADLNFDALLDLSDVQAFVNGFVAQTDAGDINGDGIFDLADVSAFVSGFNDCELL